MKIKVTEDDIRNGYPGNPNACPVALALNRQLECLANVFSGNLEIISAKGRHIYLTVPEEVVLFIHDFDHKRPVTPFSFELENYEN